MASTDENVKRDPSPNSSDLDETWAFISKPSTSQNEKSSTTQSTSKNYGSSSTRSSSCDSRSGSNDSWIKYPKDLDTSSENFERRLFGKRSKSSLSMHNLDDPTGDYGEDSDESSISDALDEIDLNEPQISLKQHWTKYLEQMSQGIVPLDPALTRERIQSLIEQDLLDGTYEDYFPPRVAYKETKTGSKHNYSGGHESRLLIKRRKSSISKSDISGALDAITNGTSKKDFYDHLYDQFERLNNLAESSHTARIAISLIIVFFAMLLGSFYVSHIATRMANKNHHADEKSNEFGDLSERLDFSKSIPKNYEAIYSLQILHSELRQCIKRQSPSSFKYYMSSDHASKYLKSGEDKNQDLPQTNVKSYRGLVCFGQEQQWRQRLDRLKTDYGLDLRKVLQDVRRHLTSDLLEYQHPLLEFKLIVNQIEYLDFLESKRNKKQVEATIKQLKAENLQLLRRLSRPDETSYHQVIVGLELENEKLMRENKALRLNLVEKAGTTYIKQSQELEKCEKEKDILKQFHQNIAQDISKTLKQFNLKSVETQTHLDDLESLKSQLIYTRGYMQRLSDEVGKILIENAAIKEGIKADHMINVVNHDSKETRVSINGRESDLLSTSNESNLNDSNALTMDGCSIALNEERDKSRKLQEAIDKLRKDCNTANGLKKKNSDDNLKEKDSLSNLDYVSNYTRNMVGAWRRLGSSSKDLMDSIENVVSIGGGGLLEDIMYHYKQNMPSPSEVRQRQLEKRLAKSGYDNVGLNEPKHVPNTRRSKHQAVHESVATDDEPSLALPPSQSDFFDPSIAKEAPTNGESVKMETINSTEDKPSNSEAESYEAKLEEARKSCHSLKRDEYCLCRGLYDPICIIAKKPQDDMGYNPDWIVERAKLREQLRSEKQKERDHQMELEKHVRKRLHQRAKANRESAKRRRKYDGVHYGYDHESYHLF